MRKIFAIAIIFILFSLFTKSVLAQVINEFSPKGDPEWVELYNNTSSAIDLTGWTITDGANHVKSISGSIDASGYFVYENPSGWLNDTGGDSIILKDASSNTIDSITYGSGSILTPDSGMCTARTPDGSGTWTSNISCTKNSVNPNAPTATPAPTATATSAPTATSTSTPTPVSTRTPTPIPTKTASAKPSPTPAPDGAGQASPTPTETAGAVLSASDEPMASVSTPKFPFIAVGVILIGVGLLGFAFWPVIVAKLHHAP